MRKPVCAAALTILFFLMQICLMPYLKIGFAEGNLLFVWLAVVTVALDRKYTFCASAVIGILLECSVSSVPGLYAVLYPAIAMLFAFTFADMTEKTRERRQIAGSKRQEDLPALVRTPLCALCSDALYNAILTIYGYLSGNGLTFGHISRALGTTLYTLFLTILLMVPLRLILGIRAGRSPERKNKAFF